jgi:hypothetical protein
VSTSACSNDKLRELDDRERRAWSSYSESIRELTGGEYERAEGESWDQLQSELRNLARHRDSLAKAPG